MNKIGAYRLEVNTMLECCYLITHTVCKAELYAAEIATQRNECNRIFAEMSSVHVALMKCKND